MASLLDTNWHGGMAISSLYMNPGLNVKSRCNKKVAILKDLKQYDVFGYIFEVPAKTSDISEYLGSGVIKGLGPETARQIVNKFGLQTIHIIENDVDRLTEVEGVGPKTIEAIKQGYPGPIK
jgi:ATP-dependent exoDNAse (exonuclease V) alpha subunit